MAFPGARQRAGPEVLGGDVIHLGKMNHRRVPKINLGVDLVKPPPLLFKMPRGVTMGARVRGQRDGGGVATRAFGYTTGRDEAHGIVAGPNCGTVVDGNTYIVPADAHGLGSPNGAHYRTGQDRNGQLTMDNGN